MNDIIEVMETEYKNNVINFTIKIKLSAWCECIVSGYIDFYNHIRISNAHNGVIKDLSLIYVFLALNEKDIIKIIQNFYENNQ